MLGLERRPLAKLIVTEVTPDERAVVQMHPVWGIELLAAVEFPWDSRPSAPSRKWSVVAAGGPAQSARRSGSHWPSHDATAE